MRRQNLLCGILLNILLGESAAHALTLFNYFLLASTPFKPVTLFLPRQGRCAEPAPLLVRAVTNK